jgi:hypothetical protein
MCATAVLARTPVRRATTHRTPASGFRLRMPARETGNLEAWRVRRRRGPQLSGSQDFQAPQAARPWSAAAGLHGDKVSGSRGKLRIWKPGESAAAARRPGPPKGAPSQGADDDRDGCAARVARPGSAAGPSAFAIALKRLEFRNVESGVGELRKWADTECDVGDADHDVLT